MSDQRDRDEFIATMSRQAPSMPLSTMRGLMRAATTLHRLAERACNGEDWQGGDHTRAYWDGTLRRCPKARVDWFTRNGVYIGPATEARCPVCEATTGHTLVTRSSLQEATIRQRVTQTVTPYGFVPQFSGDPRGAVLRLARTTNAGETGLYVPAGRR